MLLPTALVLLVGLWARGATAQGGTLQSQCPQVLDYDDVDEDGSRYTANILLRSAIPLRGFRVEITFDKPVILLGNGIGVVQTEDNMQFFISTRKRLNPGPPLSLQIFVEHSSGYDPVIESIKLNDLEICPRPPEVNAPFQTEPRRALVRPGGSVSLLGHAGVPLDFCHFYYAPSYARIDLSQGRQSPSTRDYEYHGAGLEAGECGITLRNIHDGMDGIIESKIKAADKPEWQNSATTLRVTNVPKERLPVFEIIPNVANLKTGDNLTIICNADREINMCHIYLPGSRYFNLDNGAASAMTSEYRYYGNGLKDGHCGVSLTNVDERLNGFVVCKIGLWPESTQGAWETDSFKATTIYNEVIGLDVATNQHSEIDTDPATPATPATPVTTERSTRRPPVSTAVRPSGLKPLNGINNNNNNNNNNYDNNNNNGNFRIQTDSPVIISPAVACGVAVAPAVPLITKSQSTYPGQWPWHTAIYRSTATGDLQYACGGTLISATALVTAAHCVTQGPFDRAADAATIKVFLGKYHLQQWSDNGVQEKRVRLVMVHPAYNRSGFHNDIAVLTLMTPATFTEAVRPACLWDADKTDVNRVEGEVGTVVGWGFDEAGRLAEELMMASMPVVPFTTCLWSKPSHFLQFSRPTTFCAGFVNGTSVCNGDSGGGLIFPTRQRDNTKKWYLRGLVSNSVPRTQEGVEQLVCDPLNYVVFTDVAQYLVWINNSTRHG